MRLALILALLLGVAAGAQSPANLNNFDLDAIDRTCKPCDDFFQYSMGRWHAQNPIPASNTVWSKRWAGADGNREVLRTILEGLAARRPRAGTAEQLIGDFYAACTNTAAIDQAAAAPLRPSLQRIGAIKDRVGLQREIANLHRQAAFVAFEFYAMPDSDSPRDMVAGLEPGSRGLPDRDYYLKEDAASKAT